MNEAINNELERVHCLVCGSNNHELISDRGQFNIPLRVVICKDCGLVFLNPRWTKQRYAAFYKTEYDRYYRPAISDQKTEASVSSDDLICARLKNNTGLEQNKCQRILDIGSGTGESLLRLNTIFPYARMYAIESSDSSRFFLEKNMIKVITSDVDDQWFKQYQNTFDLVIMRHVLEHFLNPLEVLKKVRQTLSSTGLIYIAVPDNMNPSHYLLKKWFRVVHTYYFSSRSLENLLALAGFEIIPDQKCTFHKNELYLFAKKSEEKLSVQISKQDYVDQKSVFDRIRREDRSIFRRMIRFGLKIIKN